MTGVRACAQLCGATAEGVEVGSRTVDFIPGPDIRGGSFEWDIGTSGSATMLALSVLPVACFAAAPVRARITGQRCGCIRESDRAIRPVAQSP